MTVMHMKKTKVDVDSTSFWGGVADLLLWMTGYPMHCLFALSFALIGAGVGSWMTESAVGIIVMVIVAATIGIAFAHYMTSEKVLQRSSPERAEEKHKNVLAWGIKPDQ